MDRRIKKTTTTISRLISMSFRVRFHDGTPSVLGEMESTVATIEIHEKRVRAEAKDDKDMTLRISLDRRESREYRKR